MDGPHSLVVPYAFQVFDDKNPNKKQYWTCYGCGREYFREDQLMAHFRQSKCRKGKPVTTVNGNNGGLFLNLKPILKYKRKTELSYECEQCGFRYHQFSIFFRHILERHTAKVETIIEPMYECHLCKKAFDEYGVIKIHMRRHTGLRPFRCGKCDRRFMFLGSFKQHLNIHK